MRAGTRMLIARFEVSLICGNRTVWNWKLRLMWNEEPYGKLPKARFDGRLSPSSMEKSGGGLKVCKSVDCGLPGASWATGSISKFQPWEISCIWAVLTRVLGTTTSMDQPGLLPSGKRATSWKRRKSRLMRLVLSLHAIGIGIMRINCTHSI